MKYKKEYLKLKKAANRKLNRWNKNKKRARIFGKRFLMLQIAADRYIEKAKEDIDRLKYMYVYKKYLAKKK